MVMVIVGVMQLFAILYDMLGQSVKKKADTINLILM